MKLKSVCKDNNDGFTLVELIVVILIIGILTAVSVQGYNKHIARSKISVDKNNCSAIQTAVTTTETFNEELLTHKELFYNVTIKIHWIERANIVKKYGDDGHGTGYFFVDADTQEIDGNIVNWGFVGSTLPSNQLDAGWYFIKALGETQVISEFPKCQQEDKEIALYIHFDDEGYMDVIKCQVE